MSKKWIVGVVVAVFLVACGRVSQSPEGQWTLYVPSDMQEAARAKSEPVPSGTMEVRSDGTIEMDLQLPEGNMVFEGRWSVDGTKMTVRGRETITNKSGRKTETEVVDTGSFSGDFKTVRVHGKDFSKTD